MIGDCRVLLLPLVACRRLTRALLQGTLFGLFFVILLVEIVYLAVSWDHAMWAMSPLDERRLILYTTRVTVVFFARVSLILLTALMLVLLRSKPVDNAEQVLQRSSCFSRRRYPCQY